VSCNKVGRAQMSSRVSVVQHWVLSTGFQTPPYTDPSCFSAAALSTMECLSVCIYLGMHQQTATSSRHALRCSVQGLSHLSHTHSGLMIPHRTCRPMQQSATEQAVVSKLVTKGDQLKVMSGWVLSSNLTSRMSMTPTPTHSTYIHFTKVRCSHTLLR
jgi:hypothetical protein